VVLEVEAARCVVAEGVAEALQEEEAASAQVEEVVPEAEDSHEVEAAALLLEAEEVPEEALAVGADNGAPCTFYRNVFRRSRFYMWCSCYQGRLLGFNQKNHHFEVVAAYHTIALR
jgi:hypothetical protein